METDLSLEGRKTNRKLLAAAKGQEVDVVRTALRQLESLCKKKIDAAEDFKEACKAVGQRARIDGGVIATYVNARVKEDMEKTRGKAEQLELLFSELS